MSAKMSAGMGPGGTPDASRGRWRRRLPWLVLAAAAVVALGVLVASAFQGSLTFYRTPSELVGQPQGSSSVRVGGLVAPGSVHQHGRTISFTLTDGVQDLRVVSEDQPAGTFREGQGAVVEGHMGTDGRFDAGTVIVRHSNQYQPSEALQ